MCLSCLSSLDAESKKCYRGEGCCLFCSLLISAIASCQREQTLQETYWETALPSPEDQNWANEGEGGRKEPIWIQDTGTILEAAGSKTQSQDKRNEYRESAECLRPFVLLCSGDFGSVFTSWSDLVWTNETCCIS